MRIEDGVKLDFCDVLIRPKRSALSSRREVELERTFHFKNPELKWTGVPIMVSNMDTTGTFTVAEKACKQGLLTAIHKYYTHDEWVTNYNRLLMQTNCSGNLVYTMGMGSSTDSTYNEIEKATKVLDSCPNINFICIDVANGYTEKFVDYVSNVRRIFKNKIIIAGNVVTREMTEALIIAGANIVKIGIGPGSACMTRKVAGVGYPQLSTILECADAAHGMDAYVLSDGGCTSPGDVAKAFGAGTDFVMIGGMFAGTDEAAGEPQYDDAGNIKSKKFYGMSSSEAMNKYSGGVAPYRSSEGRVIYVPYSGPIEKTIKHILGGVSSACTYTGAERLKDLPRCTTFIRVNRQLNETFESYTIGT